MERRRRDPAYLPSRGFLGPHRGAGPRTGRVNIGMTLGVADVPTALQVGPDPAAFDACTFHRNLERSIGGPLFLDHCIVHGRLGALVEQSDIRSTVVSGNMEIHNNTQAKDVTVGGNLAIAAFDADGPTVVERVAVSGYVSANGNCEVIDSYAQSGWFVWSGPGGVPSLALSEPGQVVIHYPPDREVETIDDVVRLDIPDDGSIAVVDTDDFETLFGPLVDDYLPTEAALDRLRIFASLIGRPRDGSAGPWLHGSNRHAWLELDALGGIRGDAADEDLLALALTLNPNP